MKMLNENGGSLYSFANCVFSTEKHGNGAPLESFIEKPRIRNLPLAVRAIADKRNRLLNTLFSRAVPCERNISSNPLVPTETYK